LAEEGDAAGEAVAIAGEVSEVVASGAAVALTSGVAADGFVALSKGSSVNVSSAGVENLAPPSESLSGTGVVGGSPVSSCALSNSSGSTRSVGPGALDAVGAADTAPF
jgi:hypothetical protein